MSFPITDPYLYARSRSQLAALAMEEGRAVACSLLTAAPALPSVKYKSGIPKRGMPGM